MGHIEIWDVFVFSYTWKEGRKEMIEVLERRKGNVQYVLVFMLLPVCDLDHGQIFLFPSIEARVLGLI